MRFLLCGINAKYIHSNLAIFSLKAYADRKKIPGAEIILKEYTINNYVEDILQDLYEEKADVVIFSCYIWNISFVRELAAELKKVSPDVKIWAGGPEVSYAANKFLMENSYINSLKYFGKLLFCCFQYLLPKYYFQYVQLKIKSPSNSSNKRHNHLYSLKIVSFSKVINILL